MKRERIWLLFAACLGPLLFTGLLLAQTASWDVSISLDPAVIDLTQGQREVTVTVTISRTESVAEHALVICGVQPGEVISTSPGVYHFGSGSAIWVGDVLTDQSTVFSLTARPAQWPETQVPCAIIEAGLVQHRVTGTIGVVPYQFWLPAALNNYAAPIEPTGIQTWTYPTENWLMQSAGTDLTEATAGSALLTWRYDWAALTLNQPPSTPGQPYYLTRSLLAFDLTALPAGEVISAWLELHTYNTWYGQFDLKFERGSWSRPPTIADWAAYSETLGVYDTGQWLAGVLSFTVPLPGLIGQPRPDELNLTLRGDETTELPIGALNSLRTHIALQWPDNPLRSAPETPLDDPISRLHLIIAPEAAP